MALSVAARASLGLLGLFVVGVAVPEAAAFRVLGLFPFNGRSHNIMFAPLMETLAERGHEVVMLSPFPQKSPRANYTDVDLSDIFPSIVNQYTLDDALSFPLSNFAAMLGQYWGGDFCRKVFSSPQFVDIMSGAYGKFDVVFSEVFGADCWAAVAYKWNLPLISISTQPDFPWMYDRVGAVTNPSYLIDGRAPFGGKMSLWQRVANTGIHLGLKFLFKIQVQDPADEVVREFFGADTPPITEMVQRTSLLMVNSHLSLNPARPVNPNTILVSGLHVKKPPSRHCEGLDGDLCAWMDAAEGGVIFFTLGSLVRTSTMPHDMIRAFKEAFAALGPRYRVLWKYEQDDEMPSNVRTAAWLPQFYVLAHPKTVLFITHGGLMGTTEAAALGVPMIGIPLFTDQPGNVATYRHLGIAEGLDISNIDKDVVLTTIRKMVDTDKYRARAREVAALYADRPLSAMDEAVWWTEYVVRHRGAPHLKPIGADLPLYQYLLLDVIAVVVALALAVLALSVVAVRLVCRLICCRQSGSGKKKVA